MGGRGGNREVSTTPGTLARMARAKARAVVVLVVACAATLAATVPHLDGPVSRVAKYDADTGDPVWDNRGSPPTDGAALRRAGVILPGGATYYVDVADGPPGLAHDVVGAASLFFP